MNPEEVEAAIAAAVEREHQRMLAIVKATADPYRLRAEQSERERDTLIGVVCGSGSVEDAIARVHELRRGSNERDEARADLDRRNVDDRAVIERLNARREAATIDEAERVALVAALRAACEWAPLIDTRAFVVPIDAAVYVAHEHAAAERAARAEAEKLLREVDITGYHSSLGPEAILPPGWNTRRDAALAPRAEDPT
jgi:hypothetical protein